MTRNNCHRGSETWVRRLILARYYVHVYTTLLYIFSESGSTDEPPLLYVLTEERSTVKWSNSTFSQRLSRVIPFVTALRESPFVREISLSKRLDAIKYVLMQPGRIQWFVRSHSIEHDFIGIIDPFLIHYTVRTATLFTVNELNGATVSSAMKRIGKHWAMYLENAIQSNYSYVKIYSFWLSENIFILT